MKTSSGFNLLSLIACLATVFASATASIVTNTNDSGPGSLRQALANAQDGDTIQFDSALNGQTITLTTGELAIDKTLTITGPGPGLLAVSGASVSRIFHLLSGHVVAVEGLTLRDGNVRYQAQSPCGGAILNDGATLTISNCIISGNSGVVAGGICSHAGQLTIVGSTISSNSGGNGSSGDSGGIYLDGGNLDLIRSTVTDNMGVNYGGGITRDGGTVTITDSTISNNRGGAGGGGIKIGGQPGGTVDVRNSTITGNRAGNGGGILNFNSSTALVISNSTVNGNFGLGGAIYGNGSITNCTISDNTADFSGGGFGIYATGALEIGNTILKAGAKAANILNNGGTITSHGYNLSSDNGGGFLTGPGDQINTDPMLGPLQDNGGSTFTHSLLRGSPAIDTADPNFTPPPFYDQRDAGYLRVYNGRIDIGSFEVQPVPTPPPESISIFGSILYCSNPSPGPVPNVVLTFTGSTSGTTSTSSSGNYLFSVASGGNYVVTPTKAARIPGSANINTVDVIAVQKQFLTGTFLSGCKLAAADVNGDNNVNTQDVIAVQRFFNGLTNAIANVGKYKFTPANRTYTGITTNQTGQNYDTLIFGDVAPPFAE